MTRIIIIIGISLLINLPDKTERILTKKLASEDHFEGSSRRQLRMIEWIRLYPLKKTLLVSLWLFCLYATMRGIVMVGQTHRQDFLWITITFLVITIATVRKVWGYIKISYHCVPVFNRKLPKQELQELLNGEHFQQVPFQNKLLQKYTPVLLSENWAVIEGTLISRTSIQQIKFVHDIPGRKSTRIQIKYRNGEEFHLRSQSLYARGEHAAEMLNVLKKVAMQETDLENETPVIIENTEIVEKKDKDLIYWNMNYRGKFKRTLCFIPVVVILCSLTPLFMGNFWMVYDIILVFILILQLVYTYRKMKEESQKQDSDKGE